MIEEIKSRIVDDYLEITKRAKNKKVRTPKGTLKRLISEHTTHPNFNHKISVGLIKKRCQRKQPSSMKIAPMFKMELKLSKILITAGRLRNPQPTSEIIELANELIQTPENQNELIKWRENISQTIHQMQNLPINGMIALKIDLGMCW